MTGTEYRPSEGVQVPLPLDAPAVAASTMQFVEPLPFGRGERPDRCVRLVRAIGHGLAREVENDHIGSGSEHRVAHEAARHMLHLVGGDREADAA